MGYKNPFWRNQRKRRREKSKQTAKNPNINAQREKSQSKKVQKKARYATISFKHQITHIPSTPPYHPINTQVKPTPPLSPHQQTAT
jgi:5-formyltetrahydrofolate cyclo-ligase